MHKTYPLHYYQPALFIHQILTLQSVCCNGKQLVWCSALAAHALLHPGCSNSYLSYCCLPISPMQSSDSPLNSFIGNAFCPRELDIFFFHTILCKPEIDSSFFPRGHIRKLQMFWRVLLNNHYKLVLVRVCVTINQLIIIISSGIKKVF